MTKKLLLTFALLLTAVTGAFADDSGSCGDVSYSYVESTHTLTISGTGAMADYDKTEDRPWDDYVGNITTVVIGDGVTSIGELAFKGCSGLTSINIPAGVTTIGNSAFKDCENASLTSITIPASVTSIGDYAFFGCFGLTTVTFDGTSTLTTIGEYAFLSCSNLTSITIPSSVTTIGNYAFSNCSGLTSIEIPSSVTSIGNSAFKDSGLTSVTVYAPSCTLGEEAFSGCGNLTNIYVFSDLVNNYKGAENWDVYESKITGITGGYCGTTGHETDVTWLLTGESSDYTLTISGTGDMEDYSSSPQPWSGYWMDIKTIVIESGVTSIGTVAFSNCDGLTTVTFDGTSTLTTIGNSAFFGCTSLTSVTIPASVTTIDLGAFNGCSGLTTVTFDGTSTLTTIGEYAFLDCSNLTSITIPASVTTIGGNAFKGCSGLTSITIPASATSIALGVFAGCTNLATMTVDAGNPKYDSRNSCNAIIETSTNTLIAGCKNTIIPDDVTTISSSAFEDCSGLTSIEIPASVTKIHDFAFAGCSNLATMTVDAGNPKYDSRNSCNAIIETSSNTLIAGCKNSTIPSSVTTILFNAFFNCTGLTSIEIPSSVTSIGYKAFAGCSGLTSVTVYAPSCTLGNNAFRDCASGLQIYVFSDKVESYQAADNWSDYASKITGITDLNGNCGTTDHESDVRWVLTGEDPYTLTIMKVGSTGDMKDYDDPDDQPWKDYRSSITKVVIGSGVTHIGDNAFEGVDDAKFSAFVTKDNFYSFFDNSGSLLVNVTFDELIFQGEFSDLVSYITLDRTITITGDNAVLNDIAFIIAAEGVTLNNLKLVANSNLGNLIDIAGENATISNMYITYVVDEAANAINVYPGANGTQILNNKIYFESTVDGYAVDEVTNAICVNSGVSIFDDEDPIEGLVINGNEITAVIPAFLADIYENEYYVMGLSAVNGVRINGAEDFKFTNNTLNVTTNQLDRTTPTLQGMYVASSSGLINANTISMIDEDTPAGKDVYLYAMELINDEELTISDNDFNISTTGGKEEAGAANAITAIASDFRITNNTFTTESKGPNLGIYFPSRMGAPCDAAITGNIIKVTGLATSAHNTGLVSGIEIQTGDVEISGNTIYTYNIGEYAEGNYIYGISNAQDGVNSNSITDNTIYTEGKYAISLKSVDDAVITENALCAHELFGDDAVEIKDGSGNTVENNILGYVIPKTGERTYNIPANVSSFKVYDDGGKGCRYSPGCDGALTLTAPEGYRLQLSGNIRTEKDVDYLSVYDGSSNLADVLIDQVSSSASGELTAIPTVTSTGQSIIFYFHSDNSNKDNSEFDGLDLTVTLVYTITYNLNEGTNATGNPATYTVNTETFTLDDPSRDGYEFAGWFSDAEFNTPATTTIEQGSTGNKTFWAKWKKLMTNSDITIAAIDDQEWTGNAIEPTVTVKDGETDITDQCDFEFTDNSDTGEATVTITAKSTSTDYAGSTSTTFNIVPKAVTSDGGTAITEDQDGMTAIIDESTQNGGVVPDEVTDATLTYTRTIPNSGDAWTVCLPYDPPTGDDVKYYTLESVSGTTLNFTEVTSPQAQTPYLVVASSDASVGTSAATVVNFSAEVQNPEAVDSYQFKGTLRGLDHDASVGKYILQSNNKWGIVLAEKTSVYIPPFRAYIESTSDARSLDSNLNDDTTGVDTIRTIDADGTEQWFDLSGRHIDKPTKKGLYIHNGKKEIVK